MFNDEIELFDESSNLIGRITIYPNGDKIAYDGKGSLIARYNHNLNITTKEPYGNIIARCDAIMTFFPNVYRTW